MSQHIPIKFRTFSFTFWNSLCTEIDPVFEFDYLLWNLPQTWINETMAVSNHQVAYDLHKNTDIILRKLQSW